MQSYEVAIVGAGPAGSTCGRLLNRAGISTLVIDKEVFPREKPCAGWVTPQVFQKLQIDPNAYRPGRLLQEIKAFRTGPIYGKEIETRYQTTVSYGIRRSEFDAFLLNECKAEKKLGEPVESLERDGNGWVINGCVKARILVGAGGHHCPVAVALGAQAAARPVIAAKVTEYELGEDEAVRCLLPAGVPVLCFTKDLKGYGWLMRKGRFVNIGLGSMEVKGVSGETAAFSSYMGQKYRLPGEPKGFRGHAYLPYLGAKGRSVVGDAALLIGDAAGLSFFESGEGILPAVESAAMAATAIRQAQGDYRKERLESYAWALERRFGGKEAAFELPQTLRRLAGSVLLSSPYLTRRFVLDKWFLHLG